MANQSSKSKRVRGLFICVLSSADGKVPVNSIGTRTDVKHWVTVENLGGYPADIICGGRIGSNQPVIKFDSGRANDSVTVWTDNYPGLPDGATQPFSHVTLLPTSSGKPGSEIVHVDLRVTWPQPARNESPTLYIQVYP